MPCSRTPPGTSGPAGRGGWTAIELLVVVALVALLVSLLLPALALARQTARQNLGLGNLRQLGVAAHLYAGDFNGFSIPSDLDPGNTNLAWQAYLWAHYLRRNAAAFQDPQIPLDLHFTPATSSAPYDALGPVAYLMNGIRPKSTLAGWSSALPELTTEEKRESSGWTGVPANSTKNEATGQPSWNVPVRFERARAAEAIYITDHRVNWSSAFMANAMVAGILRWLHTDHGSAHLGAAPNDRRKVGLHQPSGGFNALFGDGHGALVTEPTSAWDWIAYVR